ncbi:MAG: ComEC family competence protein, partial [Planctomycetes bacterium]|nr:ComEC family competence protein [Planctomycetota bacterium]
MGHELEVKVTARHRPLLPVVIAFAAGILFDRYLPPDTFVVWGAALAAWALCGLTLCLERASRLAPSVAMLCVFTSGAALHDCRFHSFPSHHIKGIARPERTLVRLQGLVIEEPSFRPAKVASGDERWPASRQSDRTSFVLAARNLSAAGAWRDVCGKVRVNVYDQVPDLKYGDLIEITGYLRTPSGPRNPGQFDFADYLHRKGIEAYLSAQSAQNLKRLAENQGSFIKAQIYRLGRHFKDTIDRELPSKDAHDERASLVRCIVLGEREAVSDELNDAFIKTGTVHLLAVSGLNVALIAGTVWFMLRLFFVPRRVNAAVIVGFVWGYAVLAGLSPSVTRASLMATVFAGGVLLKRQTDGISSLAAAALCVLLANPSDLFDAGAQLSFLAVLGIMTLTQPIQIALRLRPSLVEELQSPEERFWLSSKLTWSLREAVGISLAAWVVT